MKRYFIIITFLFFLGIAGCNNKKDIVNYFINGTEYNEEIENVTLPNIEGYEFVGWLNLNGEESSLTSGQTVYANFKPIEYKITYILNGSSSNNVETYNIESDFELNDAYKEGYSFIGWENNGNIINRIEKGTKGNITLEAIFDEEIYDINYYCDDISNLDNPDHFTINSEIINLKPIKKDYYEFLYWTDEDNNIVESIDPSIAKDINLYANWVIKEIVISYEDDNQLYLIKNGIVKLKELNKIGYKFLGWINEEYKEPIMALDLNDLTKNIVLNPVFELINYNISYNIDVNNVTSYTVLDELIEFNNPTKEHYEFLYWMDEDNNIVDSINPLSTKDYNLTANFKLVEVVISYDGINELHQVSEGLIELNKIAKEGYQFIGWRYENDIINTLDLEKSDELVNLTSMFEIINYKITYNIDENLYNGYVNNNTKFITKFDTVSLNDAYLNYYDFSGWYKDNEFINEVKELSNINTNITLYGYFIPIKYTISLNVEGLDLDPIIAPYNDNITNPGIINNGYRVVWYTDTLFTNKFEFDYMPNENITLYGKYEDYLVGNGFINNNEITDGIVENQYELQCFMEYVIYNRITQKQYILINYSCSNGIREELRVVFCDKITIRSDITMGYGIYYNSIGYFKLSYKAEGIYTTSSLGYSQIDNAMSQEFNNDTTIFPIDYINETYIVDNTLQLQYVLEHGYKPICQEGSTAELVYKLAKDALNKCVSNEMSAFQKIVAIHDYIVLNAEYDYNAEKITTNWGYYDAFYAEGVFINKKAVCDGFSRAFVIMCRILGIPAIEVTGNGHAWNKVWFENNWYVLDTTWDSPLVYITIDGKYYELLSYNYFMMTDQERANSGFASTEYTNILADNKFDDFYSLMKYSYNNQEFDMFINDYKELVLLLNYILKNNDSLYLKSLNIASNEYIGNLFYEALKYVEFNYDYVIVLMHYNTYNEYAIVFY